jgi:hypothetical protein
MTTVWQFGPDDILSTAALSVSATADVPTCIVVNGSTSTLGEGDGGGAVTTVTSVEVSQPYALKGGLFLQDLSGNLIPQPGGGDKPVEFQVVRRVTTTTTKQNGCLVRLQVDEERPFRPEAVRYRQLANGTRSYDVTDGAAAQLTFVDAGAVKDDQNPAFRQQFERLLLVSRVVTTPSYTGPEGEREFQTIQTGRHHNPGRALFLEDDPEAGSKVFNATLQLGSGAGVAIEEARFFGGPQNPASTGIEQVPLGNPSTVSVWLQLDTEATDHRDGYVEGVLKEKTTFETTERGPWIFDQEGADRSEHETERGVPLEEQDTIHQAIAGEEGSHNKIRTETDRGVVARVTVETLAQYLPAVDTCSLDLALRKSSAPVAAIVCAGESTRRPVVEVLSSPWVETVDEARDFGIRELRERHAPEVSVAIPPNGTLVAGRRAELQLPHRGFTHAPCWIETIRHAQEERAQGEVGGPILGSAILRVPTF